MSKYEEHMNKSEENISSNTGNNKKKPKKRRGIFGTILIFLIFFAGVALILYPWASNLWNEMHQSRAIMSYTDTVDEIDAETYAKMISDAEAYNERLAYDAIYNGHEFRSTAAMTQLATDGQDVDNTSELSETEIAEHEEYTSLLNYDGSGMMGYITIPCIDVTLPIYHGTSDAVLQTSVGHIEGSSLPVGGESSHCVLSGHRGLPSARLFTDLDQVQIGNTFVLTILNETYTYQVERIDVIEPDDFSLLQIEEGKDLCTLVTCTPYGINTYRLLVTGVRVPNGTGDSVSADQSANHGEDYMFSDSDELEEISYTERLRELGPYLAGGAIALFVLLLIISLFRRRK